MEYLHLFGDNNEHKANISLLSGRLMSRCKLHYNLPAKNVIHGILFRELGSNDKNVDDKSLSNMLNVKIT